jgi:hypothetical protein
MKQFNQLTLHDESTLGFLFVGVWILLEIRYPRMSICWLFGDYLCLKLPDLSFIQGVQVAILLAVALSIPLLRHYRINRTLSLSQLDLLDPEFSIKANKVAYEVSGKQPVILISKNLRDGNAFCPFSFNKVLIVLGGGLRLLARKDNDRAMAIIAHESAHLHARDTVIVLVIWYLFISFLLITLCNILVLKIEEFILFIRAMFTEITLGTYIQEVWRTILLRGFPSLISCLPVLVLLLSLIRMREFYADERAAQHGFRVALCNHLQKENKTIQQGARSFYLKFHPDNMERISRLTNPQSWAKFNFALFLSLCMTIIAVINFDSIPLPSGMMPQTGFFGFSFVFVGMLLLSRYLRRVCWSKIALGATWLDLILIIAQSTLAITLGASLTHLMDSNFLQLLMRAGNKEQLFATIRILMFESTQTFTFGLFMLSSGTVISCAISAHYKKSSLLFKPVVWDLFVIVMTLIFQVLFNLTYLYSVADLTFWNEVTSATFDGKIDTGSESAKHLSSLSNSTFNMIIYLSLAIVIFHWMFGYFFPQNNTQQSRWQIKMHPEWCINP